MKKFLSLFLIVCATALNTNAQDYLKPSLSYAIHPGTVTTLEGQIIQGYIHNSDNESNQNRCIFYADYKDRRSMKKYQPADIAGYSIENNQYKSVNYSGSLKLGKAAKNFVYVSNQEQSQPIYIGDRMKRYSGRKPMKSLWVLHPLS